MLPFTREEFFGVFATYNAANWPAAIVAYPLALTALVFAWRGSAQAGRAVAAVLALMWGWVGIVYQGLFFALINPVARAFAAAFALQALLFAWHAWSGRGFEYGPRGQLRTIAGGAMILYALILYPLIGLAVGERYPAMPLFGVTPCPLLIFTFGLMLWASCARWWLWIMPLLWAVIGGSAAVLLSVLQDWALPISGAASLVILWRDHSHHFSERDGPSNVAAALMASVLPKDSGLGDCTRLCHQCCEQGAEGRQKSRLDEFPLGR